MTQSRWRCTAATQLRSRWAVTKKQGNECKVLAWRYKTVGKTATKPDACTHIYIYIYQALLSRRQLPVRNTSMIINLQYTETYTHTCRFCRILSIKCVANTLEMFLLTMHYNSSKCQDNIAYVRTWHFLDQQGVVLTGRNITGPP